MVFPAKCTYSLYSALVCLCATNSASKKLLDPAAFSTNCAGSNLTKLHTLQWLSSPGREPCNNNGKALTVHSNADRL